MLALLEEVIAALLSEPESRRGLEIETLPHIARGIIGSECRHVPWAQSEQAQTKSYDAGVRVELGIDPLLRVGAQHQTESLTGNPSGVELMDYVRAGQVIRLGPHQTIVLSYMASCVRETITGGTVIVGTQRSEVQSGPMSAADLRAFRHIRPEGD